MCIISWIKSWRGGKTSQNLIISFFEIFSDQTRQNILGESKYAEDATWQFLLWHSRIFLIIQFYNKNPFFSLKIINILRANEEGQICWSSNVAIPFPVLWLHTSWPPNSTDFYFNCYFHPLFGILLKDIFFGHTNPHHGNVLYLRWE